MPDVERTALVLHSAPQMYALVNDVARYPEFLPGCVATEVQEESLEHMLAIMTLQKGPIAQQFSTSNTLIPDESIQMELANGPFEYLEGGWTFTPLSDEACKIAFRLNFKFKNRLIGAAFSKYFSELTLTMVDAFTKRAKHIYGAQA